MADHDQNRQRVAPLSDLSDYEVADHDPDVRGWDVIAADGRKIGEVEDLIVDTGAMKVRYLDVEVDKDFRADDNRRILIPVGQARLHENEDHVHVEALSSTDVRTFPAYQGRLDRSYEDSVHSRFGGSAAAAGTDYYANDSFDDERFYGARRGETRDARGRDDRMTLSEEKLDVSKHREQAGEVRLNKHVETEHVRKEVPVTHEEAVVERRPLTGADALNAKPTITEDEIRIPLNQEEVSVSKRTVPKEEIVVKKHQVEGTETVEADLRHEEVDIDRSDATRRDRDSHNR
jgi:uncharacterized protein (TIGR02271 family)